MIGGFRSVLCVSVFQGLLLVIVIMIDSDEKCNHAGELKELKNLNLRLCMFVKSAVRMVAF